MNIIKLNDSHYQSVASFLYEKVNILTNQNVNVDFFVQTYLSGLTCYHAYGVFDSDNNITSVGGFYESIDDCSWYLIHLISISDYSKLLEKIIEHNEDKNRLKYYHLVPLENFKFKVPERYTSVDEYIVGFNSVPYYNLVWQILFNRTLIQLDLKVTCNFLKQEYRILEEGSNI